MRDLSAHLLGHLQGTIPSEHRVDVSGGLNQDVCRRIEREDAIFLLLLMSNLQHTVNA